MKKQASLVKNFNVKILSLVFFISTLSNIKVLMPMDRYPDIIEGSYSRRMTDEEKKNQVLLNAYFGFLQRLEKSGLESKQTESYDGLGAIEKKITSLECNQESMEQILVGIEARTTLLKWKMQALAQ